MQWPLCDGTHKQTTKEPAGAVFLYTRDEAGQVQRKDVTALRPGEADPRRGVQPKVPTPGTEAQATGAEGEADVV